MRQKAWGVGGDHWFTLANYRTEFHRIVVKDSLRSL